MKGFMIAAPHSGSGKTTVTLGLLRALRNMEVDLAPAKAGPDYIDPAFHCFASGKTCINLDPWAMRPELIAASAAKHSGDGLLVVEAMMGLYDGAADGSGSAADLAEQLSLPVIFVVDCARMAQSVAALVSGYVRFRSTLQIGGVVLNRVGSVRHENMLRAALEPTGINVLGVVMQDDDLILPSRHLGLVQASEHAERESFLNHAANVVAQAIDFDALLNINIEKSFVENVAYLPPLGQYIAVAKDDAFAFSYPHILEGWKRQGAELSFFSPLRDEGPDMYCDAVFLPGGYPELYAQQIALSANFKQALQRIADKQKLIYGECGGYMVLGEALTDMAGKTYEMLNLLPLTTSLEKPRRHLGYRQLAPLEGSPWQMPLKGHEFHYSTEITKGSGSALFKVKDALGGELCDAGLRVGTVAGSYCHVIDRVC